MRIRMRHFALIRRTDFTAKIFDAVNVQATSTWRRTEVMEGRVRIGLRFALCGSGDSVRDRTDRWGQTVAVTQARHPTNE